MSSVPLFPGVTRADSSSSGPAEERDAGGAVALGAVVCAETRRTVLNTATLSQKETHFLIAKEH